MKPEQIKAVRQQMGLTQIEMAQHLGLSRRRYQELEAGENAPAQHAALILLKIMAFKGRVWVNQTWRKISK